MRVVQTTRLPNPRGKRTRRLSAKQIRIFGTKRQKAALKAKRTRKTTAKVSKAKVSRRAPRRPNPLVLHLKPMQQRSNPRRRAAVTKPKRKRKMKNTRRRVARVNPRRRSTRNSAPRRRTRRQNTARRAAPRRTRQRNTTTKIVMMAPRRNRRNGHRRGHRNPRLFGNSLGSKASLMTLGGGLAGVAAVKFIPTILPTSVTGMLGSSAFGPFIISGLSALAAWWVASKVSEPFSEGVLFGGLMQTASVGLNAFLPNLTIGGVPIALSGFGDLVPGQFAVPQNPLRQRQMQAPAAPTHAMAPTGSKVTTSGLGRAYPSAY